MRVSLCIVIVAACRGEPVARPPAPASAPRPAVAHAVRTPALATTAALWSFALESNTAGAWDAAAEAYERELAACTSGCNDLAFALVVARKNALKAEPVAPPPGNDPAPLPPREQALVAAFDRYVEASTPPDPQLARMQFLAANTLARWRQPDALGRLASVLRDHPDDEVAEYAANILLDLLNRSGNYDEMHAWVETLLADPAFLAGRDDLRATLEALNAKLVEYGGE